MAAKTTWTEIEPPAITCLPEKVFLRSEDLVARQGFVRHTHPWNQLVYATAGTLLVTVENIWYVITPEQAIWIPTGVPHTTGTLNGATFRSLYIENVPNLSMPDVCTVYAVNDLLKGLIVGLEDAEQNKEPVSYLELLHALILEQIKRLKVQDFHLPWPQNSRLQKLCEHLYAHPADFRSLDEWGKELGFSSKTLARKFEKEVGITLREWRQRLRLFLALELLCTDRSITDISLDLGYATVSAFTYMFRIEMGCTPTVWRRR